MEGALLGGILCALVVYVGVVAVVGAVFLRAAIWLYNKMAGGEGSPGSVKEPGFGKAMVVALIVGLVNFAVSFAIGLATGVGGKAAGATQEGTNIIAQLIALPVSFLVMAGLLSALLPTTFVRAILVTLCWMLIGAIVVGILAVVFVVMLGMTVKGI